MHERVAVPECSMEMEEKPFTMPYTGEQTGTEKVSVVVELKILQIGHSTWNSSKKSKRVAQI